MSPSPVRATRSDAIENRRQLIDQAREAFAESGEVSMTAIAKRAGVGVGTLYRHFPTREALIVAVYNSEIEKLAALAPALLEKHSPVEALRLWFDRLAYYGQLKYGVSEVIHAAPSSGAEHDAYELIIGAIASLLAAGENAGELKPGLDPDDVLLMVAFLWRIDPGKGSEDKATRMLDLLVAGLRV